MAPSVAPYQQARFWISGGVLLVSLLLTLGFWQHSRAAHQAEVQVALALQSRSALAHIETRLRHYERALLAARGFFHASDAVNRSEFATFVASLGLEPGIQGIGFAVLIPAAEKERHLARIRAQGYPDYQIRPPGDREYYSSIIYLEPFTGRNLRAFGYDMFSESVRQLAMNRAAETGHTAMSGKVQLVQDTEKQAGFLLYVPVYRNGSAIATPEARRRNLVGWVYGLFRMNDFMPGVVGEFDQQGVDVEIFEGPVSGANLLYDGDTILAANDRAVVQERHALTFGGQTWTVATRALPGFLARHGDTSSTLFLLGSLVSLLLSLVTFLLMRHLGTLRLLNETLELQVSARTEKLRESEDRYRALIENLPAGVVVHGPDTEILLANPLAATLLGLTLDQMQGKTAVDPRWRFLCEDGSPLLLEQYPVNRVLASGEGFQGQLVGVFHPEGANTTWGLCNAFPVKDAKGQVEQVVIAFTDITERKQVEAHNRQLQKAESLGLMAGSIAHHFNNKLQTVLANLEVLSQLPKGVDSAPFMALAKQGAEKAAEVSRLLLVYLGQTTLKQAPCRLGECLQAALPMLQNTLPSTITLETDFPTPGPVVNANFDQVQQLLNCLLTNAWEALGDRGGTVRLSLRTSAGADLATTHRFPIGWQPSQGDYACLEVADSGGGIAKADIEKLFDPFFSTKFIGRGLGLPVVLGIVQAHSGAIAVASVLGQGSVFRVYFPVALKAVPNLLKPIVPALRLAVQETHPIAVDDAAPGADSRGTLLLVDDDEMLLSSTHAMVQLLGFKGLTARDGIEAVAVFRQHQPEIRCVLTDLTMPRLDGWGTLAALRQIDSTLPVILASGYDKAQVLAENHPDRPQAFLSKPFGLEQLREALGQALRGAPNRT